MGEVEDVVKLAAHVWDRKEKGWDHKEGSIGPHRWFPVPLTPMHLILVPGCYGIILTVEHVTEDRLPAASLIKLCILYVEGDMNSRSGHEHPTHVLMESDCRIIRYAEKQLKYRIFGHRNHEQIGRAHV